jgi:hypothetical protein
MASISLPLFEEAYLRALPNPQYGFDLHTAMSGGRLDFLTKFAF